MSLINANVINTTVINDASSGVSIVGTSSGTILEIAQQVVIAFSGDVLKIEQEVQQLELQAAFSLLKIEQRVDAIAAATNILKLNQRVLTPTSQEETIFERVGFEPIITLGGQNVPHDQIIDTIDVTYTEDSSPTATFKLQLPAGTYNLYEYQAKSVTIDIRESSGTTRIFTGHVDLPSINNITEQLTLNCVADRRELLTTIVAPFKDTIGTYSTVIAGENNNVADEIEERLSTVAASLDFDGSNNWTLTSWTPKSTADFTLTDTDCFRRDPKIEIERRNQIVNRVKVDLSYSYIKSYHVDCNFNWIHPFKDTGICDFLLTFPDIPSKEMIEEAIEAAGWPVRYDLIGYSPLRETGVYNCSGTPIIWSTTQTQYQNFARLDGSGNQVTDINGNPLFTPVAVAVVDLNDIYTMSAQWNAATRFNQSVTQKYSVFVQSATSQARYGVQEQAFSYSYSDPDSGESWEQYEKYTNDIPAGAVVTPGEPSFFLERKTNKPDFNKLSISALAKAKKTILQGHRDTKISFQRDFWPAIKLRHTIELYSTKFINGKGKVYSYTHRIDVSDKADHETSVVLKTYRSTASETDSPIVAPTEPSDTLLSPAYVINLQSHYGQEPNLNWNGHIGNKWVTTQIGTGSNTFRTAYQEEFRVDTPEIPANYRDVRELTATQTYTINIPVDDVTFIVDEKP